VRGLDQKTIEGLKERARFDRRTLQQEVKALLERAAETLTMREARRLSERWKHRLSRRSIPIARTSSARIASHDKCRDVHSMI
jgi:hypothetical protein